MTDRSKKNGAPGKEKTPAPAIVPAIDPGAGGHGIKVAIISTGIAGSVVMYTSMIQGVARRYVMSDIDESRIKAKALDIAQGNQLAPVLTVEGSSDIAVIRDSDVVVTTTGAK